MRTFWILIAVLVVAAAAFALVLAFSSGTSKPSMNSPPVAQWPEKKSDAATQGTAKPSVPSAPESKSTGLVQANPSNSLPKGSEQANPSPVKGSDVAGGGVATPSENPVAKPVEKRTAPAQTPEKVVPLPTQSPAANGSTKPAENVTSKTSQSDKVKNDEAVVEDVIEKALGGGAAPAVAAPSEKKLELKQTPVKIERKSETEVLLDGTFTVKGRGTKESPYIAPWELVIAAQETYDPGQKKDEIPGAVMFLDGKHVRLTGYVCFPMYVPEPKEMLSMLNQWDGCCIGVPPTPYDAVEVHLAKKIGTDDRYAVYGNVEGVFRVKPYLSGNWLVGLYVLEDATFKPSDKGGGS